MLTSPPKWWVCRLKVAAALTEWNHVFHVITGCCWFDWPLFSALLLGPGIVGGVKEANLCDPDQTSRGLSGFLQWVSGGSVQPPQTSLKHNPVNEELTFLRSVKSSSTSRSPLLCFHIWTWSVTHWSGCNGADSLSWRAEGYDCQTGFSDAVNMYFYFLL